MWCHWARADPPLRAERLGKRLGLNHLYIKDESLNPTGSFKARGLALAIARAAELGVTRVAIPSPAMPAVRRRRMPRVPGWSRDVLIPAAFIVECQINEAHVELVDGLITNTRRRARGWRDKYAQFNLSTLKEPVPCVEGKRGHGVQDGWQDSSTGNCRR